MKHQPETTTAARTAPDQSIQARQRINAALAKSSTMLIDAGTARIIAATVHSGPGTALYTFAATGVLHANAALAELRAVPPIELPGTWREAFTAFATAAEGHRDD